MKATLSETVRAVRLMAAGYAGGSAGYVEELARSIYQDEGPSLARLNAAMARKPGLSPPRSAESGQAYPRLPSQALPCRAAPSRSAPSLAVLLVAPGCG